MLPAQAEDRGALRTGATRTRPRPARSNWRAGGISANGLFFGQPRSDVEHNGTWYFDGMPHRVLITDRLRMPPGTGHLTGETRKGDAINTLFDQMPEDTLLYLTMVATPQDVWNRI